MTNKEQPILIDYYSDVLCVWAWIAQPRLDELRKQRGSEVRIKHRYVDIFGDTHSKIPQRWGDTDGFEKFHAHVAESVRAFEETRIHSDIWSLTRPRSSLQAHMVLKAVGLVAGDEALETIALRFREAFFVDALDISDLNILLDQASVVLGSDVKDLRQSLVNGSAIAALSDDLRSANALGVKGSPTWVMNDGRQILYGNVGYRILSANIEELVKSPTEDASWC